MCSMVDGQFSFHSRCTYFCWVFSYFLIHLKFFWTHYCIHYFMVISDIIASFLFYHFAIIFSIIFKQYDFFIFDLELNFIPINNDSFSKSTIPYSNSKRLFLKWCVILPISFRNCCFSFLVNLFNSLARFC